MESVSQAGGEALFIVASLCRLASVAPPWSLYVRLELVSSNSFQIPRTKTPPFGGVFVYGPPGEIRTPDTQVRSLVLYPAELRAEGPSYLTGREVYHALREHPVAQCTFVSVRLASPSGVGNYERKSKLYISGINS